MKTSNNAKMEKSAATGRSVKTMTEPKTGRSKSMSATASTGATVKSKAESSKTGTRRTPGTKSDEMKSDEKCPEEPAGRKSRYTGDADSDFHTFFIDELKDIYWAEKHLKTGLAKMRRAATSPELAAAFDKHYNEGRGQIATLETIFELLGEKPEGKKCDAMAGLLKEAESIIEDTKRHSYVRDAGLILAAQKVEHYEIATYGTLLALAEFLPEKKKVQRLLASTLSEEKKTDAALTKLAESFVNECAAVE